MVTWLGIEGVDSLNSESTVLVEDHAQEKNSNDE
jgi:hypothetical protein